MWEIRKVYVAQLNRYQAALVSESQDRVAGVVSEALAHYNATVKDDDWRQLRHPDEAPHVEAWMVAVRFDGDKVAETVGLARCPQDEMPDGLAGVEIDIARGGGEVG